ncbi:MAG: DMT family transporter [Prevotella sp.]|nr:DMT family transporter [Prevotella sp.]
MRNNSHIIAHLCLFFACAFWGLMAPLGKDAMTHGFNGIDMVTFRVTGGAVLFWITSFFVPKEHVPKKDLLMFIGAAVFGLVTNQCCYTIGLSITSPINSSIVTTSMPIFAMILAAIILKEPITGKKALGVFMGCAGAIILILTSATATNSKVGDIRGDLLCLGAQLSFALYLSLFSKLIRRYSVFTVNKWMFTYATILILPFTFGRVSSIDYTAITLTTWLETGFVVFFGTYISYLLMMKGQHVLRPTVVSIYNYVQPIIAVTVSALTGIGVFKSSQALAVILVFLGVWFVTTSKSREEMVAQHKIEN